MSVQAIALIIGAGLIAIAIFGGNIRAKDYEVGPVGPIARIMSAIFGCLFVAGALGMLDRLAPKPSPTALTENTSTPTSDSSVTTSDADVSNVAQSAEQGWASDTKSLAESAAVGEGVAHEPQTAPSTRIVTISDTLADNQTYETSKFFLNGVEQNKFVLGKDKPSQTFQIEVKGGDQYSITGKTGVVHTDGKVHERTLRGHGVFSNDAGRTRYNINWKYENGEFVAFLKSDP